MLHISPEDPHGPIVHDLIADLSRELAERYSDNGEDGTENFAVADATIARSVFLVAWFGSDAAGCGALRPFDPQSAEVKRMFVLPTMRGRGIGREILGELERRAREFGYTRLVLETGDRQPEALTLYARAGFHQIPRYGIYVNNPRSVCLEKSLAENAVTQSSG